jgi:hypothetical protein
MRLHKRLRWIALALAAAAVAAPGAQAMAVSDDGGTSAGKVEIGGGDGVSAQMAANGGGNGGSTRAEDRSGSFTWAPALLAGAALAALGATAAALSRRPRRHAATLTL